MGFFALQQGLPGPDRNSSGLMSFETHTFKWGRKTRKLVWRAHGGHKEGRRIPGHHIKLALGVFEVLSRGPMGWIDRFWGFFLPSKIMI